MRLFVILITLLPLTLCRPPPAVEEPAVIPSPSPAKSIGFDLGFDGSQATIINSTPNNLQVTPLDIGGSGDFGSQTVIAPNGGNMTCGGFDQYQAYAVGTWDTCAWGAA